MSSLSSQQPALIYYLCLQMSLCNRRKSKVSGTGTFLSLFTLFFYLLLACEGGLLLGHFNNFYCLYNYYFWIFTIGSEGYTMTMNLLNIMVSLTIDFELELMFPTLLPQVTLYSMYVACMAFHAKVSDPLIGGTYMTLLNTVTNLGGNWPSTLALWLVDPLTSKECQGAVGQSCGSVEEVGVSEQRWGICTVACAVTSIWHPDSFVPVCSCALRRAEPVWPH